MKTLIKSQARQRLMTQWAQFLTTPNLSGDRTIVVIRPHLQQWTDRSWGALTFRATQVLTGHGCFGEYLCRIQKEQTPRCHHCAHERDTVTHTLMECPAWDAERRTLCNAVGNDLNLRNIISAILRHESAWQAFTTFCDEVTD